MALIAPLPTAAAVAVVAAVLVAGIFSVAVLDALAGRVVAGAGPLCWGPLSAGRRPVVTTEHPDAVLAVLAVAVYLAAAAAAIAVVPLGPALAAADLPVGIVVWGAAEALAIFAVYAHGWAPNSLFPLLGGYRFVALGLCFELVSMFVLIGAALPAESLSVGAIVAAQADRWNVVRQPLGLPLWIVVALGAAFWGPLAVADGPDLAGGTSAEASGLAALGWQAGRAAMLAAFSVMGAAAFLGGWWGPGLPGPLWMALKALAVLAVLVAIGRLTVRLPIARLVPWFWTRLLPLAFLHLAIAGIGAT